ncbi:MAG: hypothetical protein SAJ12_01095 [Jaaginema sp. PMC 1079.18]|nr:hypothetical protein [Jaaginema sp. PMC 1080.18]MEC4849581.1 hypothetical protein [Jaaginema sp. PMC 1079.18]MEC4867092.1 hypothetical protein [Jaaginema sp. PMC 1078.18]
MSQQLILEISDEVYADLQRQSSAMGVSLTEWVLMLLSRQNSVVSNISPDMQAQARSKFRSHAGAVSLGYPTDIDNDQIDADLAKAYTDNY